MALPPLMSRVCISHEANVALIKRRCRGEIAGLRVKVLQAALQSFSLSSSIFFFFPLIIFSLFMGAGKHSAISLDKPQQLEDTGCSTEWRNFIRGAIVRLCSQHFGNWSLD